jgi:hypothetical protein
MDTLGAVLPPAYELSTAANSVLSEALVCGFANEVITTIIYHLGNVKGNKSGI